MKFLVLFLLSVILMTGCGKTTIPIAIDIEELVFGPESSEAVVLVEGEIGWDCQCDEEWILVRQKQDQAVVVVDANFEGENRSGSLRFIANGTIVKEIPVLQEGIDLLSNVSVIEVESHGDIIPLPVLCNFPWSFSADGGWFGIDKEENGLMLSFPRNYEMKDRTCTLSLRAGKISLEIPVTQKASSWYDSFEMVPIEGCSFYMGAQSISNELDHYDPRAFSIESPVHSVYLSGYYISRYEVTQQQWESAMGSNPSHKVGVSYPVESVSWNDVHRFLRVLNECSGLEYRLPTEAEWEYAAKGGPLGEGFLYSGSSGLGSCAWYYSNSENSIHEVGVKYDNEIGLFDMSGNVREWCEDGFYYYSQETQNNPVGGTGSVMKINRGGSWATPADFCRNTYRHTNDSDEIAPDLGFRLALSLAVPTE